MRPIVGLCVHRGQRDNVDAPHSLIIRVKEKDYRSFVWQGERGWEWGGSEAPLKRRPPNDEGHEGRQKFTRKRGRMGARAFLFILSLSLFFSFFFLFFGRLAYTVKHEGMKSELKG